MADTQVQEIKDRLNLVEVITSFIPTKKAGTNFKAVCPFHNEKTPSLVISPAKQIWHCFGCGEGGDVFGFLMKYQNIEFTEALQQAADIAGVKLAQFQPKNPEKKQEEDQLVRINRFAASVYQQTLSSNLGTEAQEYLKERGLSENTIKQWEIGFAPEGFNFLEKKLAAKQVNLDLAIKAGVIGKSENGALYDRFRHRVIFPIHNLNGEVVGFSARSLPGSNPDLAKYINSPETPIYNKSQVVFGLHLAKEEIRKSDQAVVVEGQMDCIQAHQAGFSNTVATSGTALTEHQLRTLKRFAPTVVLAFDSDQAGRSAALRAAEVALGVGLEVKLASYQQDSDPDDIIRKSKSQWEGVIEKSLLAPEHYIQIAQQEFELGSLDQKKYIGDVIIPLIRLITNPLEKDHYLKKISNEFTIGEMAIQEMMRQSPGSGPQIPEPTAQTQSSVKPEETWEKEILGGIILLPDFKEFVLTEGLPDAYLSEPMREYFAKALAGEFLQKHQDTLVQEATFMVESSLENLQDNELALVRELKKSFYLFKLSGIKDYLRDLTVAIKKAELNKNTQAIEQLSGKFSQASKLRFEIETKLGEA